MVRHKRWIFSQANVPDALDEYVVFEGDPGHMVITGYKGVTGTSARTVAFWFRGTSPQNGAGQICYWGDDFTGSIDDGKQWKIHTSGSPSKIQLSVRGSTRTSSIVIEDGDWHHVAFTYVGGGGFNAFDAKIYIDGVLDSSSVGTGTLEADADTLSGVDVSIGAHYNGSTDTFSNFLDADLDEFAIWSSELTAFQVSQISNSRVDDIGTLLPSNLQVWLRMGSIAGDTAGSGGTIQDGYTAGRDAATTTNTSFGP